MRLNHCIISSQPQSDCVYTACDAGYFEEFGRAFAHSILTNTAFGVHFHIFNPQQHHLDYCASDARISVSHEQVNAGLFSVAAQRWSITPSDPVERTYLDRTINAMGKGNDRDILERMQKTYFACVRFVRLNEIFNPAYQMFAMDVDAVVRAPLVSPGQDHGFYLHRIQGKKARFLAGGIWLNASPLNRVFLEQYATAISDYFHRDYVYWGIDQDVLEIVAPAHAPGQLPMSYIDWNWGERSTVWTAKGTRKSDPVFQAAKKQYS